MCPKWLGGFAFHTKKLSAVGAKYQQLYPGPNRARGMTVALLAAWCCMTLLSWTSSTWRSAALGLTVLIQTFVQSEQILALWNGVLSPTRRKSSISWTSSIYKYTCCSELSRGSHKSAVEEPSQQAEDSSLCKGARKSKSYNWQAAGEVAHHHHGLPPNSITSLPPGEWGDELSCTKACCLQQPSSIIYLSWARQKERALRISASVRLDKSLCGTTCRNSDTAVRHSAMCILVHCAYRGHRFCCTASLRNCRLEWIQVKDARRLGFVSKVKLQRNAESLHVSHLSSKAERY